MALLGEMPAAQRCSSIRHDAVQWRYNRGHSRQWRSARVSAVRSRKVALSWLSD
ncbi:MAG: hypothetical protein OJF49_003188 [Ktedonobacterales bacterium]|nr:MAG: hypothetical protein OJF49_003188 [Ktedonobacterales bacterium]